MPTVVNVSEAKAHLSDLLARAREGGFLSYTLPDSFFVPLPEDELQAWEGTSDPWDRLP